MKEKQKENSAQLAQVEYAGFWIRFAAFIIDNIIVSIAINIITTVLYLVFLIIGIVVAGVSFSTMSEEAAAGTMGLGILVIFLILLAVNIILYYGYYVLMTYKYQSTLGKMIMKIKVQSDNGLKLSLGAVILRETVGKIVSAIVLNIGYIMAAFTDKKQALHDVFASSVVVHKDPNNKTPQWLVGLIVGLYFFFVAIATAIYVFLIIATVYNEKDSIDGTGNWNDDAPYDQYYDYDYDDYDYDYYDQRVD